MATTYTYKCDCGFETDVRFNSRPPETYDWGEHPAGPAENPSRTLCMGILKRVWGVALNMGYQPTKHSKSDQWLFKNA